ncbi:MAG: ABC transporter ATP-binding protein [Lachnospiraceae bacterium]|nr:ABC transporter ATP-binding protein [Lachnospiraceae bacterium]
MKKREVLVEGVNLTKTYGEGDACVHALDDVSFRIHKGELTVILGSSGSGKSTLLNVIGGMARPDSGKVIFDGFGDIAGFRKKQQTVFRKDSVGFVFQFYNLIPELTVWENVALVADMAKAPRPVKEVLEMMGLSHRKDHYPSQLSGGEQQRVSIARALVKNAAFLLCDEPTGALDYNTGKQILIELEKLAREQGQTVVIVTHTTSISTIADRILKMRSGRIVEEIVNPHPASAAVVEW